MSETKESVAEEVDEVAELIIRKRDSLVRLRGQRINKSKRLKQYSRKWNFVFFALNIAAIIIVVLSLASIIDQVQIGGFHLPFDVLAGVFTLYVILLQYFINILNYDERALRLSYHELEVEDLVVELNALIANREFAKDAMSDEKLLEKFGDIVIRYQLIIKNNENHDEIDYKQMSYDLGKRQHRKEPDKFPAPRGKRPKDFSNDIILIYTNACLVVGVIAVTLHALIT